MEWEGLLAKDKIVKLMIILQEGIESGYLLSYTLIVTAENCGRRHVKNSKKSFQIYLNINSELPLHYCQKITFLFKGFCQASAAFKVLQE